jgi:antitoxin PrlF
MATATLTSKGQITIPKTVRESLHLTTGDRIDFVMHNQTEAVMKPVTKTVDQVFGRLYKPGQAAKTVAQMNRIIAQRMRSSEP